jgi:integrase
MPRKRESLIRWRDDKQAFYEDFTVDGHRFRGSLGTDDGKEANRRAAQRYQAAIAGSRGVADLTIEAALQRYAEEHGQYTKSAADIRRIQLTLVEHLGRGTMLAALKPADLVRYAARRRATVSNRSVNIEIEHLRAVVNRARELWGVNVPTAIKWTKGPGGVLLEEVGLKQHILTAEEETQLFVHLRQDYHGFVRFALVSAQRLDNVRTLTWAQIDWENRAFWIDVKSKKPGGERHWVPLSDELLAILGAEQGRHPKFVFTYVCGKGRFEPHSGRVQRAGIRYPFAKNGWRKPWYRALAAAGIEEFRFHDLRHTALTRVVQETGNIRLAQKLAGHTTINTTSRYVNAAVGDVREAMEQVAARRRLSPFLSPKAAAERKPN